MDYNCFDGTFDKYTKKTVICTCNDEVTYFSLDNVIEPKNKEWVIFIFKKKRCGL